MRTITIEQARATLDVLVAEVSAGVVVEITVNGHPAARLVPASVDADEGAVPADEVEEAFYGD